MVFPHYQNYSFNTRKVQKIQLQPLKWMSIFMPLAQAKLQSTPAGSLSAAHICRSLLQALLHGMLLLRMSHSQSVIHQAA